MRAPALAAVGGIALLGKASIKAASDSEQSLGATETVFGKYADSVIRSSDRASQKYGLSANSYRENANLIGSLFKNQGVELDQLAGKTDAMISTAADLSATFGGTTKEAVEALGSAFKGEYDPMERYGVSLKESTVTAELAARGESKLTGAAAAAAKQRAITALITKQAGTALGAFGRESNTLAGQQQRLSAEWENAKSKLGTALLPVLTKAATSLSKLATAMAANPGKTQAVIVGIAGLAVAVLALSAAQKIASAATIAYNAVLIGSAAVQKVAAGAMIGTRIGLAALAVQTAITSAVTKAAAVAQMALNAAMLMNPIGLVIIAIVALVAIFVIAWKNSETFRNIVIGAWNAIKVAAVAVFNFLKGFISAVWGAIKTVITTYVRIYVTVITAAWNAIKAVTSAVWNGIKTAVSAVVKFIVGFFRAQFNLAKTIVTGAWNAVKNATVAVWNGIKTAVRTAVGGLMDIVRGIKGKVVGFFSGAASWLVGAGKSIIGGLIDGIKNMAGRVTDAVQGVLKAARDLLPFSPAKTGPFSGRGWTLYSGQAISNSLADGILSRKRVVRSAALDLAKAAIPVTEALKSGRLEVSAADAYRSSVDASQEFSFTMRLSADQVNQVQRGREIHADLKAYQSVSSR